MALSERTAQLEGTNLSVTAGMAETGAVCAVLGHVVYMCLVHLKISALLLSKRIVLFLKRSR